MMEKRSTIQWALVAFVIVATAARESDAIPNDPWGKFVGLLIMGLYTGGILKRPAATAKVLLPFLFSRSLSACSVSELYLKSDADTYKAVAPFHAQYLEADPALSPEQKALRLNTLKAWKLRIEKVGGKVEEDGS